MSGVLAIDASVALKWVVHEAGSDEALGLLTDMADRVLSLGAVAALDLDLIAGPKRCFRTLYAALDWGMTTYDALYVLLALDLETELVTADTRLVDAARSRALPVRPLTTA